MPIGRDNIYDGSVFDTRVESHFLAGLKAGQDPNFSDVMYKFKAKSKNFDLPLRGTAPQGEPGNYIPYKEIRNYEYRGRAVPFPSGIIESWDRFVDNQSLFMDSIMDLGMESERTVHSRFSDLIVDTYNNTGSNQTSRECYTGQPLYSTAHPLGSTTFSNKVNFSLATVPTQTASQRGTRTRPSAITLAYMIGHGIQTMYGFKDDRGKPYNKGGNFCVMVPNNIALHMNIALNDLVNEKMRDMMRINKMTNVELIVNNYWADTDFPTDRAVIFIFRKNSQATFYADWVQRQVDTHGIGDGKRGDKDGLIYAKQTGVWDVIPGQPLDTISVDLVA